MKKTVLVLLALVLALGALGLVGCDEVPQTNTTAAVTKTVEQQDKIYNDSEPIPVFNYSLPRHMWVQFYKATTQNVVRTWTCEVGMNGRPISEVQETIGYPIPMDTQLTNPVKVIEDPYRYQSGGQIVAQAEPNGLYTSPNTNATIYFTLGDDDQISPNYCEAFVVCKAYPFHWDESKQIFVRDTGAKPTLLIDTEGAKK